MKKEKWELFTPGHIGCQNVRLGKDIGFGAFIEVWHHHFETIEEAKKTALLISKTPEMLELLEKLCSLSPNNTIQVAGLMDKAEQLIKKLTKI